MFEQLLGLGLQLRPQRQRALHVGEGQRVLFDAYEMQPRPGTGAAFEQVPGAEEIQPCAEAGFTDGQTLVGLHGGEAAGQIVLRQEYVLGLGQPAGAGEIHIAIVAGLRQAVLVPVEFGVLEGVLGGVIVHHGS